MDEQIGRKKKESSLMTGLDFRCCVPCGVGCIVRVERTVKSRGGFLTEDLEVPRFRKRKALAEEQGLVLLLVRV